jgi:hypothetical protein
MINSSLLPLHSQLKKGALSKEKAKESLEKFG